VAADADALEGGRRRRGQAGARVAVQQALQRVVLQRLAAAALEVVHVGLRWARAPGSRRGWAGGEERGLLPELPVLT